MKARIQNTVLTTFILTVIITLITTIATPLQVGAAAHDPNDEDYDYGVRFWEDDVPDVGFYINAAARYTLETVEEPGFGTGSGEWTMMNLLRAKYTGYDYINHIPTNYFDGYYNRVEEYVAEKDGDLNRNKSTEWSRAFLTLSSLNKSVTDVAGYDFIEKLSSSHSFMHRQGINGPIWGIIALNTGQYDLYADATNDDVNTVGKMIDFILDKEIEQDDGTVGGWALMFNDPDADITGMALQALAPYYQDKELYNQTDATASHNELKKAVERSVSVLSEEQADNGAFKAFNNVNTESTSQVIVGLTALGIDPLSDDIDLPTIDKNVSFIQGGKEDGVHTDNMIDALLAFFADGSGSEPGVSGFKHTTSGNDGGGGAGHGVNGMATDQALYGLIAYDRFVQAENTLYDMTDMMKEHGGTHHSAMKATEVHVDYKALGDVTGEGIDKTVHPYEVIEIPDSESVKGKEFNEWNSEKDGSGSSYDAEEKLSVPNHDITLYAQYEAEEYTINYELNEGNFLNEDHITTTYTVDDEVALPTADDLDKSDYTFVGWYDNEDFDGEKVTKIEKDTTGDKTYYADWVKTEGENERIAQEVTGMIDELPSVATFTLDDREQLEEVKKKLHSLTKEQQELVKNKDKIDALEEKVIELIDAATNKAAAENIIGKINKLPNVHSLSLDNRKDVAQVRQGYDLLSESRQELVDNFDKLEKLEAKLVELKENKEADQVSEVDKVIQTLPSIEDIDMDDKEIVNKASDLYYQLSPEQQEKVDNHSLFKDAEKKILQLEGKEEEIDLIITEKVVKGLPELEALTLDNESSVQYARERYEELVNKQVTLIGSTKEKAESHQEILDRLDQQIKEAEQKIAMLKTEEANEQAALEVDYRIAFLPTLQHIMLKDQEEYNAVQEAYDALNATQLSIVDDSNVQKLKEVNERITELQTDVENNQAIEKVESLIDALPSEGSVTLEDEEDIEEASLAFSDLTEDQQRLVKNANKLSVLEKQMKELTKKNIDEELAKEVEDMIESLPKKEDLTIKDKQAVNKALEALLALTDDQKKLVESADTLQVLEKQMKLLEEERDSDGVPIPPSPIKHGPGELDTNDQADRDMLKNRSNNDEDSEKMLPKSATNMFNTLLIGILFIFIGGSYYFIKRARV